MNIAVRFFLALGLILALALMLFSIKPVSPAKKTLIVYTYDSFASQWGPGPALKSLFEQECQCVVEFVTLDDALAMLARLRLEAESSTADLVLGLDMNTLVIAKQTKLFAPHQLELPEFRLPSQWTDDVFIPFDYGFFAWVYDSEKLTQAPKNFSELLENKQNLKYVIQDPRSSTPGLGLLLWVKSVFGDQASDVWRQLAPSLLTVTPGWSEAYGLFLKGEADMVLSYTTSPAYHIIKQAKSNYVTAEFESGHYIQIETAARLKNTSNPELAKQFLAFLLTDRAQQLIPTGNWMYPVVQTNKPLPEAFNQLVEPKSSLQISADEIAKHKNAWVDEFINALSQ